MVKNKEAGGLVSLTATSSRTTCQIATKALKKAGNSLKQPSTKKDHLMASWDFHKAQLLLLSSA